MSKPAPAAPIDQIQRDFQRFHAANPHVLEDLEHMAAAWFDKGHPSISIGMLFEALRWLSGIETTGDVYRLNNNYQSRYVRLMIARRPEWAHRFQVRELTAAA